MGWFLDFVIVAFLMLQTFIGWRRGLLWQAAGVASLCFGMLLGLALAPSIGSVLTEHVTSEPFRAKMIAFLFIVGAVGAAMRLLAAYAEVRAERGLPKPERESRRRDDRVLGGIFGAFKGCVLALVLVAAAFSMYPHSGLWRDSSLAGPLAAAGSRLLPEGATSEVKRWAVRSAADLKQGLDIK